MLHGIALSKVQDMLAMFLIINKTSMIIRIKLLVLLLVRMKKLLLLETFKVQNLFIAGNIICLEVDEK